MSSSNETHQENQINRSEKKIKALAVQLEHLDREVDELFRLMGVTQEQLTDFIEKEEHFTKDNWEELRKQRVKLEERLNRSLNNIRNPLKTKRAYSNLHIANHWLYVK